LSKPARFFSSNVHAALPAALRESRRRANVDARMSFGCGGVV
jgi:hypothetical protein